MTIHRRPATDDDKAFLKRLNEDVYRDLVVEQFGVWNDQFQSERFEQKWQTHAYQIVEQDGRKIGAVWVSRESDHLWLREIQLSPTQQNQGIGTKLILGLMEEAKVSGLPLRLRVLTANRAKSLYERLGFRMTGMHEDNHYWMEYTA